MPELASPASRVVSERPDGSTTIETIDETAARGLARGDQTIVACPPLVVIAGPPGAGKGTQCRRIGERLGLGHLSIGDELRQEAALGTPLGVRVREHLAAGRLVDDREVLAVVFDRLARHIGGPAILLDGFPRTLGQAHALDDLHPGSVVLVVLLGLPSLTIRGRLRSRNRADDRHDVLTERLLSYERDTKPMLDWYSSQGALVHVDASLTPDDVTSRIEGHLTKVAHDQTHGAT